MKKRLFVGVPVDDSIAQDLEAIQRKHSAVQGLRWTARSNLHVTVCFLGMVAEEQLDALVGNLAVLAAQQQGFSMTLADLASISKGSEHMLWAQLVPTAAWDSLVKQTRQACESFLERPPRYGKQIPHITLARGKSPISLEDATFAPRKFQVPVQQIVLYESLLDHTGSRYTVLSSFPLSS